MTTQDELLLVDLELRDIYYNPVTGYQSMEKLYKAAIEENPSITRKQVREWLHSQKTFTTHKTIRKPRKFQKTFVKNLGDQLQMDLVDMTKFDSENNDIRWILTGIEILSRFGFAVPVARKNTEKMVPAVEEMLKEFKKRFNKYPEVAQFDEGKEFYNVGVKELLKSHDISYFSTERRIQKAALVERFNRTLKTRMWKYFTFKGNKKWLNSLDKFVLSYNNTIHSTIKMKPKNVNNDNQSKVFFTLFGIPPLHKDTKPKFNVGDHVRIQKFRKNFAKGYDPNFSDEIYTISAVFRGVPVMYRLEEEGENMFGKFYGEELVKVVGKTHK